MRVLELGLRAVLEYSHRDIYGMCAARTQDIMAVCKLLGQNFTNTDIGVDRIVK